jgi:hypothetical protein
MTPSRRSGAPLTIWPFWAASGSENPPNRPDPLQFELYSSTDVLCPDSYHRPRLKEHQ